jgi:hypothetical protein
MKSFFGSLQSKFKSTYEGRFFSTILAEVLQAEPKAVCALFPNIPGWVERALATGEASVVTEHRLEGGRRADLAILVGGVSIALAEIKQADIQGSGVTSQLKAYRSQIRQAAHRVDFSLVSQFEPYDEHRYIMDGPWGDGHGEIVRFHNLATRLRQSADRPAIGLLRDYMKEQGMTGYAPLAKDSGHALTLLMTRLLPTKHAHGLGRLHSNEAIQDISTTLGILLANARHMEDWLRLSNERHFRHVFTTNFKVWPWYDKERLAERLSRPDDGSYALPDDLCTGGELMVETKVQIAATTMGASKGKGISLLFGYDLQLDIAKKHIIQNVFAMCSGSKSLFPNAEWGRFIQYKKCRYSTDEPKIRKVFKGIIAKVCSDAAKASTSKRVSRFLRGIDLNGF